MSNRRFVAAVVLLVLSLFLFPRNGLAQSLWIPRGADHAVTLEVLRPSIETLDQDVVSAGFFLTARIPVASKVAFVGEVPFARLSATETFTDFFGFEYTVNHSNSAIGNVYLGLETRSESCPIFGELGVRLPLANDENSDAETVGLAADLGRFDAFLPEYASVHAGFNVREVTSSNIAYRLRLAPFVLFPTSGNGADPEIFGNYSWQVGYEGSHARVGVGAAGHFLITESYSNLGSRSDNQLELHADFLSGPIRPGVDLHLPLDSNGTFIPVVVGFNVSWVR